ncbi:hypothetical protein EYF80_056216 [Liparis tanakae]|uniref:Uncharacterized protein n=1 Tax=Liparis tanakae TaxID=230148 RepID=A0A4Z2EXM4_9TELE|nr:hypothetical protein EYF80_056216 [Liparis tanakae]
MGVYRGPTGRRNICQTGPATSGCVEGLSRTRTSYEYQTGSARRAHLIGHHVEEVAVGAAAAARPLAGRHRAPERLLVDRDHSTFGHERPAGRGLFVPSASLQRWHPHILTRPPGGNATSKRGTPLLSGPGGRRDGRKGEEKSERGPAGCFLHASDAGLAGGSGPWGIWSLGDLVPGGSGPWGIWSLGGSLRRGLGGEHAVLSPISWLLWLCVGAARGQGEEAAVANAQGALPPPSTRPTPVRLGKEAVTERSPRGHREVTARNQRGTERNQRGTREEPERNREEPERNQRGTREEPDLDPEVTRGSGL